MESVRRNSKKRQAIYDALLAASDHPSAEQIYTRLKPEHPDLSLGTVYRNLGVLLEENQIIRVGKVAGEERFDARTAPHAHFVCTSCGAVLDVFLDELTPPDYTMVEAYLHGKVNSHALSFFGLCMDCNKKNAAASPCAE